jgi:hypothetical protein
MPAHVYVSYSQLDTKLAMGIATGLEKLGHKITIWEKEIGGGSESQDVMARAMENCNALVVLITPNSLERPFVMAEIGAARALKKKRIPVIFDGVEVPRLIRNIHPLFATRDKPAPVVKQIDQALAGLDYRNVFIVHGQNEAKKLELKEFLTGLGLRPVILHEQGSKGKTIIEKFSC